MGEDVGVAENAYLVSIKEDSFHSSNSGSVFGVCFVDTCIGTFHVSSPSLESVAFASAPLLSVALTIQR